MLERFEKYMEDIQANVKLLTAERDKLSVLYNEVRTCVLMQPTEGLEPVNFAGISVYPTR